MKNQENWRETKFQQRGGRLRASLDVRELGVGSRLMADLVAGCYDAALPQHASGRVP